MAPPKRLKILSLDGGGFRGLSTLIMLQTIFHVFKKESDQPNLQPCDFFDLIVGTSTGGIIALMLGRLRMSIEECIQAYSALGEMIFGKKQGWPHEERFNAERLKDAIQGIVESKTGDKNALLLDPLGKDCCKVAICALIEFDLNPAEPEILRSYRATGLIVDERQPWTIWEAARATSAAITYFEPLIRGDPPRVVRYYDAGLGHNNPAHIAHNETGRIWGKYDKLVPPDEISLLLSLGTGVPEILRKQDAQTIVQQASAKFKIPIDMVEAMQRMVTDTEKIAVQMNNDFGSPELRQIYFRFNVEQGLSAVQLFEWEKEEQIRADTKRYMDSRKGEVRRCSGSMQRICFPEAPVSEDTDLHARMERLRVALAQPVGGVAACPMECSNCGTQIKWEQPVYWCLGHNKCICEDCYQGRRSAHAACNLHKLRLFKSNPQPYGQCSNHCWFFGNIREFQGVTCERCPRYNICQLCIRRSRKPLETHICSPNRGSAATWVWRGTSRGVRRAWSLPA